MQNRVRAAGFQHASEAFGGWADKARPIVGENRYFQLDQCISLG